VVTDKNEWDEANEKKQKAESSDKLMYTKSSNMQFEMRKIYRVEE